MNVFEPNWLTEPPHDYELKYYKLLAGIDKIKKLISANSLYSAILEVETELEKLYNIKYGKDEIESKTRIITGIDVDTMSLKYDYPEESEAINSMYDVCDIAIDKLEDLYRVIRDKWRLVESQCIITEIPDKKHHNTKGYIFYIDVTSQKIHVYSYVEPSSFKINWSEFKLKKVEELENSIKEISNFIAKAELESTSYRFFRFDTKFKTTTPPYADCMLPIMKSMLFNRIKHGI
jgi:hypothetical protein